MGLELETEAVEKAVGAFSADLVCRDVDANSIVLIENQFESTDHDHLGKLLTYAAGLQAQTVIWLSGVIRAEHRAALDWLNEVSREEVQFFGLEIELWRISDSDPAVKFNIVSKPNDWSRSLTASRRGDELTELQKLQSKYWEQFLQYIRIHQKHRNSNRKPRAQHWMTWHSGSRKFRYSTIISPTQRFLRVELIIQNELAQQYLDSLEQQQDEIETKIGDELVWGDQSPEAQMRRVSYYLRDVDLNDESDWERQHKWLADHLEEFQRVFTPLLAEIESSVLSSYDTINGTSDPISPALDTSD